MFSFKTNEKTGLKVCIFTPLAYDQGQYFTSGSQLFSFFPAVAQVSPAPFLAVWAALIGCAACGRSVLELR